MLPQIRDQLVQNLEAQRNQFDDIFALGMPFRSQSEKLTPLLIGLHAVGAHGRIRTDTVLERPGVPDAPGHAASPRAAPTHRHHRHHRQYISRSVGPHSVDDLREMATMA